MDNSPPRSRGRSWRPHWACEQEVPKIDLPVTLGGRYRVERELGRGGMATVYLAEEVKHRRPVAVKVLRPELAASLGAERFLHVNGREHTVLALQHREGAKRIAHFMIQVTEPSKNQTAGQTL